MWFDSSQLAALSSLPVRIPPDNAANRANAVRRIGGLMCWAARALSLMSLLNLYIIVDQQGGKHCGTLHGLNAG